MTKFRQSHQYHHHYHPLLYYYVIQNNNYARFKPPKFSDGIVQKNWDPRKTPTENLQNLGLQSKPNASINSRGLKPTQSSRRSSNNDNNTNNEIQLFDVPDSDTIALIKAKNKLPVSIEDQKYIIKCFEKYGNDYAKMSRDIKVNDMQYTEHFLRKIGSRFLLMNENQRRVDVPENIRHLLVADC